MKNGLLFSPLWNEKVKKRTQIYNSATKTDTAPFSSLFLSFKISLLLLDVVILSFCSLFHTAGIFCSRFCVLSFIRFRVFRLFSLLAIIGTIEKNVRVFYTCLTLLLTPNNNIVSQFTIKKPSNEIHSHNNDDVDGDANGTTQSKKMKENSYFL